MNKNVTVKKHQYGSGRDYYIGNLKIGTIMYDHMRASQRPEGQKFKVICSLGNFKVQYAEGFENGEEILITMINVLRNTLNDIDGD